MRAQMIRAPFGHTTVQRVKPATGPENYKTYGISMPLRSHWRPATCEEVDCEPYRHGWVTTLDLSTADGQMHAATIKGLRGYRYSVQQASPSLVKYVFPAGQTCFHAGTHRLPLERPPTLYVAEGDWRGNPRRIPVRVHSRADLWVEDYSEHQDRLATAIRKG